MTKEDIINVFREVSGYIDTRIKIMSDRVKIAFIDFEDEKNANFAKETLQELKTENGRYYGQVVNGLREGKGTYYLDKEPFKGDRYDGEWKNDKRDGKGIEYFHNGDKYEGDWRNGKFEGKGVYYYYNSGNRYKGDFKDGEREGKGIMFTNVCKTSVITINR